MLVNTFVVLALCELTTAHLYRKDHIFIDEPKKWSHARNYCKEHYADLSTFESDWEQKLLPIPANLSPTKRLRIGLVLVDGNWGFIDQESLPFERWNSSQPDTDGYEKCAAVNRRNRWFDVSCQTPLTFFCFYWTHELILVRESKTWEEALMHCRSHHTDLAGLPLRSELLKALDLSGGAQTPRVWTSLRFLADEWLWVDRKLETGLRDLHLYDLPMCPAQPLHCGALGLETETVTSEDCLEKFNFICYEKKGVN